VFCAHNAPIARLQPDVKTIADIAKGDRDRNLLAYHVLESFDFLGRNARELKTRRCARDVDVTQHVLTSAGARIIEEAAGILARYDVARRRLRRLAALLVGEGTSQRYNRAIDELKRDHADAWQRIEPLYYALGEELPRAPYASDLLWLHLEELWDYLPLTAVQMQRRLEAAVVGAA
jgi:hypothetical protein